MAERIVPEIVEGNMTMKKKLANGVFEFINVLSGPVKALKITCMLVNENISNESIKSYLSSFSELRKRVLELER